MAAAGPRPDGDPRIVELFCEEIECLHGRGEPAHSELDAIDVRAMLDRHVPDGLDLPSLADL